MKKVLSALLSLSLVFSLAACGGGSAPSAPAPEEVEVIVFAAASLTETLNQIAEQYKSVAPQVKLTFTFDSSGTLQKQIEAGAECDLFLSAAPKQMNALEEGGLIDTATRLDLLENKVTLAVPQGNPAGIESYDQLAGLLKDGSVLLAMGNSDVPVGQYTLKIFDYYGIDEAAVADKLTYGSNVKEVTTQVGEGAVDCGIIYATDAASAGLTVVDEATAEMCGQVIYPAAVLKESAHAEQAAAFLDYLKTEEAQSVFASVGFAPAF